MSDNEIARLIYLLLLLAVIGGLVWSSGRLIMRRHLKQLLAWVAIFLMFILLYSQVDVIIGQLDPGRGVLRSDGRTIALARSASGSFEAVLEVNGQNIRFLVDTGASDVVLSRRDAERVGIDVAGLSFLGTATTANGKVETAKVTLDRVGFSGIEDRDVPATVNGGNLNFSLLGMSYLSRFTRIEISGNQMLLVR